MAVVHRIELRSPGRTEIVYWKTLPTKRVRADGTYYKIGFIPGESVVYQRLGELEAGEVHVRQAED